MKKVLILLFFVFFLVQTISSIKAVEDIDYEDLFTNHQSVMLIIHPITGEIYYANQAASEFYGYPLEILLEMNINQINTLTPKEVAIERLKALEEERNFFIFNHKLSNDDIRTVYVYSYPVIINGETYLYSIIIDQTAFIIAQDRNIILVTFVISILAISTMIMSWLAFKIAKKKREIVKFNDTLHESEQRYRVTLQSLDDGVVIHAPDSSIIDFNNRALEILGLSRDQILGKTVIDPIWKFIDEDEKPLLLENYPVNLILTNHKPINDLIIGVVKSINEEIVWAQVKGTPIFDFQGDIKEAVISFFDISDLKNAYTRLAESEQEYRLLTTEMPLGLALNESICDENGKLVDYRFVSVNDSFELLTGLKREDILGKTALEVSPNMERYWIDVFGDVALNGNPIQYQNYAKEIGKYINTSAYSPKKGQFAVIVEDITERVLIENQLTKKHEDLMKSQKIAKLGTWRLDVKTNEVTSSEELYKIYGFDPNKPEPSYTEHMNLFTKDSWNRLSNALELTRTKGIPYELELEMAIKDDSRGWMWVGGEAEYDDQGQIVSLTGAAQNITHQKKAQEIIKQSYETISEQQRAQETLISNLPGIAYRCKNDDAFTMIYISNQVTMITGYTSQDFYQSRITFAQLIHPEDKDMVVKVFSNAYKMRDSINLVYRLIDKMGNILWVRETAKHIIGESGENTGFIEGFIEEITKQKLAEEEIIYAADHDYSTNLYNRRYLVNAFKTLVSNDSCPAALMMVDINGLKMINDAYGHVRGDESIRQVANLLMEVFDQDDVVARIGGDEFAVLSPNKNALQMQENKDKLVSLSQDIIIDNIPVSLAIGFEILNNNDKDIDELLSRAEKQLYRHKITVGGSNRNHAIKAILNTLTDKYKEEKIHSAYVSQLCRQLGIELGLSKEEVDVLELAGMYHDIGKISIPDAILNKPGKLTDEEYEIIKTHTQVGYQILKAADEYSGLAEYALSHHERWDGRGYPNGLKGKNIPLFSRIINVADSFEAMTADRPYQKGESIEDAILEIKRCSGTQFDPEIANIFLEKVLK